jgi:hypothetical protein
VEVRILLLQHHLYLGYLIIEAIAIGQQNRIASFFWALGSVSSHLNIYPKVLFLAFLTLE